MEPTNVDWQSVERSPEFRELVKRRKAFVLPAAAAWIVLFGTGFGAEVAEGAPAAAEEPVAAR